LYLYLKNNKNGYLINKTGVIMKLIYISFSLICILAFLFFTKVSYATTAAPKFEYWACEEDDREDMGWRVLEDTDGDGVYDTETIKDCMGLVDRHKLPGYVGGSISVGTVPKVDFPCIPDFTNTQDMWYVIQKDSSTNNEVYRVVHKYTTDTTYIAEYCSPLNPVTVQGRKIPYLQGEFPKILEGIVIKPNPANDYIDIEFPSLTSYVVDICMGNIDGKELYKTSKQVLKNTTNTMRIDVSKFPSGSYFIKFDASGLTHTIQVSITR
jgi:hypothetical protein